MARFAAPVLALFLLGACSGLRGKADDLMGQGNYWEAVQMYSAALEQDARDEAALVGLRKARNAYIDKKLIEIRMARLGGSQQLALDFLLELSANEKSWDTYPLAHVGITQEEENSEAFKFVESQVRESIKGERPLRGLYLMTHYRPIFAGSLLGHYESLMKELHAAGQSQCRSLSRIESPKQPYFSEFVRKVCVTWGIPNKGKTSGQIAKRGELYRGVRIAANIEGLPTKYQGALQGAVQKAFEQTPWYDPHGQKSVILDLVGNYRYDHDKLQEQRVHGYSVRVPYTDYETVTKYREVPYATNKNKIEYRRESYTEQQPVTRYRSEERYKPYFGVNHRQEIEFRLQGELKLAGLEKPVRLDGRTEKQGFEHHWNMPNIGLRPESPDLEHPETWVKQQVEIMGSDLKASAGEIWDSLFCEPMAAEPTLLATGDQVHRCLRSRLENPPQYASVWYEKFFGVNVAQANELLNLTDL